MEEHCIRVDLGKPFEFTNGGPGAIALRLRTSVGTLFELTLPPGGRLYTAALREHIDLYTAPGTSGISPLPDPESGSEPDDDFDKS